MTEKLSDTLLWLCRTPSPIGEERALCDAVAERLGRVPLAEPIRRHGDSIVVPLVRGTGKPHLVLGGHLDVVRTQHDGPPRIDGDKLYGAGAADMKSGLALLIELAERPTRPAVDLTLVFYAREEGPYAENELGPVLAAEPELTRAALAVMLEPSDNKLQLGCGGSLHATVAFQGRTAHSARPWQGENAVHKAAGLLARLGALNPMTEHVDGLEWKSVVSATLATGGRARNVIPDRFELNLNHRFGPSTSIEQAKAHVESLVRDEADVTFTDLSPSAPPHRTHPLVVALTESGVEAVEPKQAWTDVARFHTFGVPAVNFGPGTQAQAHQKNEWTELSKLEKGSEILQRFLTRVAALALPLAIVALATSAAACDERAGRAARRTDAVADAMPAGPSLLDRSQMDRWIGVLRARFGPSARVLSLDARAQKVAIQVADSRNQGEVLEYAVTATGLSEPIRAELRGKGDLDTNLFLLRVAALERLPEMVSQATLRVDAAEGKVERVLLRRQLPQSNDVRFRVYVESPRVSGQADFEASGRPVAEPSQTTASTSSKF
jgi:succinyl-diaminopimelate desuccinylase